MPSGNILVVEDHDLLSSFICEALTEEGYTVRAVLTSAGARQAIAEQRPDLVLMDLYLAGETGDRLAQALAGDGLAGVPIILMTARQLKAHEFSDRGIDFCLMKPFDLADLLDCVATYVKRKH
jgi:DNA-binding response OmpR family regulator